MKKIYCDVFKKFAKEGLKTIGVNVFMKNLDLLELGYSDQDKLTFDTKGRLYILNNKYICRLCNG